MLSEKQDENYTYLLRLTGRRRGRVDRPRARAREPDGPHLGPRARGAAAGDARRTINGLPLVVVGRAGAERRYPRPASRARRADPVLIRPRPERSGAGRRRGDRSRPAGPEHPSARCDPWPTPSSHRNTSNVRLTAEAAVAAGEVRQLASGAWRGLGRPVAELRRRRARGLRDHRPVDGCPRPPGSSPSTAAARTGTTPRRVTFRKVGDRDFYLGRFVGDAARPDTTCTSCWARTRPTTSTWRATRTL
jgi:hypothetical protein